MLMDLLVHSLTETGSAELMSSIPKEEWHQGVIKGSLPSFKAIEADGGKEKEENELLPLCSAEVKTSSQL